MRTRLRRISKQSARILSYILLLAFVAIYIIIGKSLYETYRVRQVGQQLRETRYIIDKEEDWSGGMLDINEDYVGWLSVYGTDVNGPVVQGEDNEEYLRTNIYKEHSMAGVFFMDETVDTDVDGNVMIFGHLMNDGTMFGSLKNFKNKTFFKQNGIVRWDDKHGEHYYRLFAGMVINGAPGNDRFIDLQKWMNEIDPGTSEEMLEELKERAFMFRPNAFREADNKYIFLVTCDYSHDNDRLVLVGERIRG